MTTYVDNVVTFLGPVSYLVLLMTAVSCVISGRWYLVIPGVAAMLWLVTR